MKHGYGEIKWPQNSNNNEEMEFTAQTTGMGRMNNANFDNSRGYKGNWIEDEISGEGIWILQDGTEISGVWQHQNRMQDNVKFEDDTQINTRF